MRLPNYFCLAVFLEFITLISSTPTFDSFYRGNLVPRLDADLKILAQPKNPGLKNPNVACNVLQQILSPNDVVTSASGSTYTTLYEENWSTTCWLKPACIVTPKDSVEVSHVMKALSALNTTFAIRSGGHKDAPGFASIGNGGVLIALSQLKSLSLSHDKSIATIGPGLRWGDVYSALEPQGRIVVGGRVSIVGVGGLILGGGLSYFSNQYGLAFDNIARFEAVLADGSIVNATRTNNQDLFWALKGGCTNFGVITAFDLETHSSNGLFYEARTYSLDHAPNIFRALADYQTVGELDEKTNVILQFRTTEIIILFVYSEPAFQPPAFSSFYQIPSTGTLIAPTNGSLTALALDGTAGFASVPERTHGQTFSHKVDASFSIEAYNIYLEESSNLPPNCTGTYVPQAIAKSTVEFGKQRGGNAIGLKDSPQQWLDIFFTWANAADDEKIYSILNTIISRIGQAATARGVNLPYLFMNDAGSEQAVLQSFGVDNVRRLKSIAAKYDPKQVFQRLQNDGFLLTQVP